MPVQLLVLCRETIHVLKASFECIVIECIRPLTVAISPYRHQEIISAS